MTRHGGLPWWLYWCFFILSVSGAFGQQPRCDSRARHGVDLSNLCGGGSLSGMEKLCRTPGAFMDTASFNGDVACGYVAAGHNTHNMRIE